MAGAGECARGSSLVHASVRRVDRIHRTVHDRSVLLCTQTPVRCWRTGRGRPIFKVSGGIVPRAADASTGAGTFARLRGSARYSPRGCSDVRRKRRTRMLLLLSHQVEAGMSIDHDLGAELRALPDGAFLALLADEVGRRESMSSVRDSLLSLVASGPTLSASISSAVPAHTVAEAVARARIETSARQAIFEHPHLEASDIADVLQSRDSNRRSRPAGYANAATSSDTRSVGATSTRVSSSTPPLRRSDRSSRKSTSCSMRSTTHGE